MFLTVRRYRGEYSVGKTTRWSEQEAIISFAAMIVRLAHVQEQRLPGVDRVGAVEAGVGEASGMASLHVAAHVAGVTGNEPAHRAPEPALAALYGAGADQLFDLLVHRWKRGEKEKDARVAGHYWGGGDFFSK